MRPGRRLHGLLPLAVALAAAACDSGRGSATPADARVYALLRAQDRRAAAPGDLEAILDRLTDEAEEVRRVAVRALGRLERPDLVGAIAGALADASAEVRAVAAWSLAQAVSRGDGAPALEPLLVAAADDPAAEVRAAAAVSLGRLEVGQEALDRIEAALVAATGGVARTGGPDAEPAVVLGAARGLESLARRHSDRPLQEPTLGTLHILLAYAPAAATPALAARVRALAFAALAHAGAVVPADVDRALADSFPEVRRRAARQAAELPRPERAPRLERALADRDPSVRTAALQGTGTALDSTADCPRIGRARTDPDPHVRLSAIDLSGSCPDAADALAELAAAAPRLESPAWHEPAHALVALARVASERALPLARGHVAAGRWQARMYAARAAAAAGWTSLLERLADDPHPNVRTAALRGLQRRLGHAADAHYRTALRAHDPQLLLTAAGALAGSPEGAAALPALFDALERLTATGHQTTRDPRRALLERIGEFARPADAARVRAWLTDFDPVIAATAATILERLTGEPARPAPRPAAGLAFPSWSELERLARTRLVVSLAGGGSFTLRLLPWEAPTNAARFARMADAGVFAGLTFHRVVPDFVIQGGSPGANEYAGHGAFTRDELTARSHLRGTVGVSTRGRDTGDGQIFVNLVDNVRLDHEYTIFAEVVSGMDAVDAVLEGAVIERVETSAVFE